VALGYLKGEHAGQTEGLHVEVLGDPRPLRVRTAPAFDPDGTRMRG
jgi:dimethylglycine dehydrogenase